MCIADMIETIINDWDAIDWDDVEAACTRHFRRAMHWECVYATSLAEDVRRDLSENERIMALGCVEDPLDVRDITLPAARLRFITYTRVTLADAEPAG